MFGAILACLSILGCDEARLIAPGEGNAAEASDNDKPRPDPSTPADPTDDPVIDDSEFPEDPEPWVDKDHNEPEVPGEAPGDLSGTWRVATRDGDKPGVYFDIAHTTGAQTGTGTYTMGFSIFSYYDGESGEVASVNYQNETLTLMWNPTDDSQEMLTLTATKLPDGTYQGAVSARRNPDIQADVLMTRLNP